MKNILFITLFLISSITFAQNKERRDKIKELKIAHITEQLDLTKKEAQAFWPVYNAHEDKSLALRKSSFDRRKKQNFDELTEVEASEILIQQSKIANQKFILQEQLITDLKKILPSKKILKLLTAEHEFRGKMLKKFKELHRKRKEKKE